jgi:hypothetical protein
MHMDCDRERPGLFWSFVLVLEPNWPVFALGGVLTAVQCYTNTNRASN